MTRFALIAVAGLVALAIAGCGGSSSDSSSSGGGKLDVVGYSTPEAVYEEALEPGFEATSRGRGRQLQQLLRRLRRPEPRGRCRPARLRRPLRPGRRHEPPGRRRRGSSAKDWDKQKYDGIAQDSVVVIVTRKGNPEGIESFDDLLTKDVDVITPNPFSSGSARWNIMAVYGSQLHEGKSEKEALDAVKTAARKDRGPARQRPRRARRLHPGRGRRPARLRERGDQGPGRGRGRRLRDPAQHDPDRDADRGHQRCAGGRPGVPRLHLVGRRPGTLG